MRFASLFLFFAICFGAAGIGGMLTSPGLPWLATLQKPPFNPPGWVFGPVWTVLYGMMALSGHLAYSAEPSARRTQALVVFAVQLMLNVGWSALFFYLRQPSWALAEILFLLAAIWTFVALVWPVNARAAQLFIPYGLWVIFATILNASFWWLNR